MKKKILIIVTSLIFVVACCLALAGCDIGRRYDNETVVSGVVLLRNKLHKKSLAARCIWDGNTDNMEFTVPDEYCGYKVKCLGAKGNPGFTGDPGSFGVRMPNIIDGYYMVNNYSSFPPMVSEADITIFDFTVYIGNYVNEIEQINKESFYGYGIKNVGTADVVENYYKIIIVYIVDSDNATFYSKDGDIYYKSNDQMIEYRS